MSAFKLVAPSPKPNNSNNNNNNNAAMYVQSPAFTPLPPTAAEAVPAVATLALAADTAAVATYSYPIDIWSLGCVAYELATLAPPFTASTLPELACAVVRSPTPTISTNIYSHALSGLISSMLEKDPQRRPTAGAVRRIATALREAYEAHSNCNASTNTGSSSANMNMYAMAETPVQPQQQQQQQQQQRQQQMTPTRYLHQRHSQSPLVGGVSLFVARASPRGGPVKVLSNSPYRPVPLPPFGSQQGQSLSPSEQLQQHYA